MFQRQLYPSDSSYSETSFPITEAKSKPTFDPFSQLIKTLENGIKEDVLLISIGSGSDGNRSANIDEQQIPTYIKNMAKAGKNVRILIVDPDFEKRWDSRFVKEFDNLTDREYFERHQPVTRKVTGNPTEFIYQLNGSPESSVQIFSCEVPYDNEMNFYPVLKKALETALSKGTKVFIGNHTNAWDLKDFPLLGDFYNSIKKSHPQAKSLQLYTQGGISKVRYYLDKPYDEKSFFKKDPNAIFGMFGSITGPEADQRWNPTADEFKVHDDIASLASLPEFRFADRDAVPVKEQEERWFYKYLSG